MDLKLVANTIRGLSIDGVQKANSGHPGMPMGTADIATVLFLKYLNHNPTNPQWPNRDRYVQSAGHGSMLLYSLLHLSGYDLSLDDLKSFRQWGSRTPGHPEYGMTPGIETTTGPLGQGCGNAVGMALAEAMLAAKFNRDGYPIIDHRTYVIAGDGDLMEGVSHEAFSLAGHLGLNKLIVFYDANRITIEGSTDLACSDDVRKRFEGYHWNVIEIDGHDYAAIDQALKSAESEAERPTLIVAHTHIGFGSPHKQDSAASHGAPLGEDEVKATKKALGIPEDRDFYVPDEVRDLFKKRLEELQAEEASWNQRYAEYAEKFPELAAEFKKQLEKEISGDLSKCVPGFDVSKSIATRKASGAILQELAECVPGLVGGSADLGPSNNTALKKYESIGPHSFKGRNLHFGIREHGMGSMLNGMALHGGWHVYGATFLIFSDYFKPAIRLAAMMELPVIYVFTHDSIFLGEDGPTHQPVEQLAGLRAIPNLTVIRPGDATETAAAWIVALKKQNGPTALVLTRQGLPVLDRSKYPSADLVSQGAYVLWESGEGIPEIILIASGSEVSVALEAGEVLALKGRAVRVVSMPAWDLFDKQSDEVKESVLPAACEKRLVIEAGVSRGWEKYLGSKGKAICLDHFGASAPYKVLAEKFGFTVENAVRIAESLSD